MSADVKHLGVNAADKEILEYCLITRNPEIMRKWWAVEASEFVWRRAEMFKTAIVGVRWLTGEFLIKFCIPGTYWPDPYLVIEVFNDRRSKGGKTAAGDQT